MRYKLKYSPDASDKLKDLKSQITASNGKDTANKILSKILTGIRGLQDNPETGTSVEAMLGIPSPYRFLHIERNYAFYRIEKDVIYITDIYDEREDFMWKMFRIRLRSQESIDFWGE